MPNAVAIALLLAVITFAAPSACLGQITYLSQDRWIWASNGAGGTPVSKAAVDFQPFDEEVTLEYASAFQTSVLNPYHIQAKGGGGGSKQNGWCGLASAHFSVTFDITEPTPWALDGKIAVWCTGEAAWTLTGPGMNLTFAKKAPDTGSTPLVGSGVLEPGMYVMTAWISTGCMGGPFGGCGGSSSFDFTWSLDSPCLPDCDGSGTLDIDDFICFMTAYSLGEATADCDASGALNIDDFICFQTAFVLGC